MNTSYKKHTNIIQKIIKIEHEHVDTVLYFYFINEYK